VPDKLAVLPHECMDPAEGVLPVVLVELAFEYGREEIAGGLQRGGIEG
jgi:hypothetical protein